MLELPEKQGPPEKLVLQVHLVNPVLKERLALLVLERLALLAKSELLEILAQQAFRAQLELGLLVQPEILERLAISARLVQRALELLARLELLV
jgi:hypothetical protein